MKTPTPQDSNLEANAFFDQQDIYELTDVCAKQDADLTALRQRVAELDKKRKDDQFECSVMSAVTGREDGETLTAAVTRVTKQLAAAVRERDESQLKRTEEGYLLKRDLAASRALAGRLREEIEGCREMVRDYVPDGMIMGIVNGMANRAIALTEADCREKGRL